MGADEATRRVEAALASLEAEVPPGRAAADELMDAVYDELRSLAHRYLGDERRDHTLESRALVHEAYLRLVDQERTTWRGRAHFFAVGARMMRRLLVDHARRKGRVKRGGEWRRVTLDQAVTPDLGRSLDPAEMIALDDALAKLEELSAEQARVVELRYFAGLGMAEVGESLGLSKRTVEGYWTHARAWLRRELAGATGR